MKTKTPRNHGLDAKNRQKEKYDMRKSGWKWSEIAAHFGVSIPTVFTAAMRYEENYLRK